MDAGARRGSSDFFEQTLEEMKGLHHQVLNVPKDTHLQGALTPVQLLRGGVDTDVFKKIQSSLAPRVANSNGDVDIPGEEPAFEEHARPLAVFPPPGAQGGPDSQRSSRLSKASTDWGSVDTTLTELPASSFKGENSLRRSQIYYKAARSSEFSKNKALKDKWTMGRLINVMHVMESSNGTFFGLAPDAPPQDGLARFVRGNLFTSISAVVVIWNSVIIGADANSSMHRAVENSGGQPNAIFGTMNLCFTIFFTIEILFRMVGLRAWFVFGQDKAWNFFDLLLVTFSLIDLFAGDAEGNVAFLRILRVFRLARVLRIVRLFKFFRELRRMVMSILASLQSLAWAFLLLLVVIYVFAIVLMRAGVDFLDDSGTDADRKVWKKFYGGIFVSMYMLIQAISGGQDWDAFVQPLEQVSEVYKVLYVFFIVFVLFGLLNVLSGVFVSTAAEFMDRDFITQAEILKDERFIRDMMMLFKELDDDHVDVITWDQFCTITVKPEVQAFLGANGLDTVNGDLLFSLCGGYAAGGHPMHLSLEDFVLGCQRLKGPATQLHSQAILIELDQLKEFMASTFPPVNE